MKCEDILYTPLDVTPQPKYDINRLLDWIKYSHNQSIVKHYADAGITAEHYIDNYPWRITPLYNNLYDDGIGWVNDFNQHFPLLANYFYEAYGIPLNELGSVTLLPMRDEFMGYGFWHNDVDSSGIRLYLEYPEQHHKLFLRKTNIPYPLDFERGLQRLDDSLVSSEEIECPILHNKQSFYLNNWRAVHATYNTQPGLVRIAAFVTAKYNNHERFHNYVSDLIIRSAQKYPEHAILW